MRPLLEKVLVCWLLGTGCVLAQEPAHSPSLIWGRSESLMWWVQSSPTPPLVTTSPPGTSPLDAGVLTFPETTTLFGGERINGDMRTGARYTVGLGLVPGVVGIEGSFLILQSQSHGFAAASDGVPILARPYFNVIDDAPAAQVLAYPGVGSGAVQVQVNSSNLYGAEVLGTGGFDFECGRVDLLAGYRFFRFDEGLEVRDDLPVNLLPGTVITVHDSFLTQNEFHGAQLGARAEVRGGPFSLSVLGKCALGNNYREVKIDGLTTSQSPAGVAIIDRAGLLAKASNIGVHRSNSFAAVPELGVRLGRMLTSCCEVSAAYTLIWWPEVVRPGDQVDPRVNSLQPVGPSLPAFPGNDSSLWIQGVSVGMSFRF